MLFQKILQFLIKKNILLLKKQDKKKKKKIFKIA